MKAARVRSRHIKNGYPRVCVACPHCGGSHRLTDAPTGRCRSRGGRVFSIPAGNDASQGGSDAQRGDGRPRTP